jgi:hypothetical protein
MRSRCCSIAHVRGTSLQCASFHFPPADPSFSAAYLLGVEKIMRMEVLGPSSLESTAPADTHTPLSND